MTGESTSTMASRYKLLLRMPSPRLVLIYILTLSSVLSSISFLFSGDVVRPALALPLLVFATIALNIAFKRTILKDEIILTLNRLNMLSFAQLLLLTSISLIGFLVSAFTQQPYYFAVGVSVGISMLTFIGLSITIVLSFKRSSYILPVTSSLAVSIGLSMILNQGSYLMPFLASLAVGAATAVTVLLMMEKFAKILNQSPLSFFRAFVASLLMGENEFLEDMLRRIGSDADIPVDVLSIRDARTKQHVVSLIVPRFHPGPFRSIGGSITPYLIEKRFSDEGMEAIVLKGISGHEMNIASYRDGERLAEEVFSSCLEMVRNGEFGGMTLAPSVIRSGRAHASVLGLDGAKVAIISLHPNPMEDLPSSLMPDGLENVVLIDAHNCFRDGVGSISSDVLSDIADLIMKVRSLELVGEPRVVELGFARLLPKELGLSDGVGPGGISCLLFRVDGKESCYVLVDGNNALPEVREHIQEVLKEEGIENFELMTTDTHLVCAITLGGRGYHPLGEAIKPEKLAAYVRELCRKSREGMRPVEASYRRLVMRGIRVFSENGLQNMAVSVNRSARLYLLMLGITPLASLLTVALI